MYNIRIFYKNAQSLYESKFKKIKQKRKKQEKNHPILSCLVNFRFMICRCYGNSEKEETAFGWKYLE